MREYCLDIICTNYLKISQAGSAVQGDFKKLNRRVFSLSIGLMKIRLITGVLLVNLVVNAFLQPITASPLRISCHPDYPPVMFLHQEKPAGITVDVATRALDHLGIEYELVFAGPWKRVQQSAKVGKIDMIAGLYFNKERDQYIDFTVPVVDDPTVIFVWRNKEFKYNTLEDLKGKEGTANLGDSFGIKVDAFIEEHLSVQRTVTIDSNFRLLEIGRANYFIYGLLPGKAQALRYGYGDLVKSLPIPLAIEKIHLGISKKSSFRHLIPKINDYIKMYINEKMIAELSEKNLKIFSGKTQ